MLENDDDDAIRNICRDMLATNSAVLCGWVDFIDGSVYARAEILTAEDLKC